MSRYFLAPLPLILEKGTKSINLAKGLDLIVKSTDELEKMYGVVAVKKPGEDSLTFAIVNTDAPYFFAFKHARDDNSPHVVSWNVFLRYTDEVYMGDVSYVFACIEALTNLSAYSPFSLILNADGSLNGVAMELTRRLFVSDKKTELKRVEELRHMLARHSNEKKEVARRLLFASTLWGRWPAYITELISILDFLYGLPKAEAKYRLKINFFLAHPELTEKEHWELIEKCWQIRSRHSHGGKSTEILSEEELEVLESFVCTALSEYFFSSKKEIEKTYSADKLIEKLRLNREQG